ncbi:YraN family protein [Flagellimonas onchidii]|uniref:YraN family protein n=1 Tax=Flagellimonas onchidii TaxID=2562684 RepID=UPI0010A65079|nr:YraN family protein [Allomuricauda onchidii]
MGKHNEFGRKGEQIAVDFLKEKRYKILQRNYRYLKAEIDIIAEKDGIVSIVEVKSRTEGFLETISETINQKKINLIVMAANQYVIDNNLDVEIRFDFILVLKKGATFEIEHTKNAFYYF